MVLENKIVKVAIDKGIIKELYFKEDKYMTNFADRNGDFGVVSYTIKGQKLSEGTDCKPYNELKAYYDEVKEQDDKLICKSDEANVVTEYSVDLNGINIRTYAKNDKISQFALNLDFSFLGKRGAENRYQILPTTPYKSMDNKYTYCIMTRPAGGFVVVTVMSECVGYRNIYPEDISALYIDGIQFFADFDEEYACSDNKRLNVNISFVKTIEDAFEHISNLYDAPYCLNIKSGGFDGEAVVKVSEGVDRLCVITPSGDENTIAVRDSNIIRIKTDEYGFYKVIPYIGTKSGMEACIWYGNDMEKLFGKCCDSIRKPYHGDENLCEGGCFLWAMLLNMRLFNHKKYDIVAKEELDKITNKSDIAIPRRSIIPYKTTEYDAYHICKSNRIQEQFFGVSILLEAYKLYSEEEFLIFAIEALTELDKNYITDEGMVYNGSDYTTVCAPVIPIVDMANFLIEKGDFRGNGFKNTAIKIADFLVRRGLDFPTEGRKIDKNEQALEDGSISCTALSVLYVCMNLHYDKKYIEFAEEVLKLHNSWTIYTPDAKMLQSSFRWWETIWEGDGEGPAVCAGHAWTIWRSEALFYYGLLSHNDQAIIDSWNGYITNFCKAENDGVMYACFEADFIRGGGSDEVKKELVQLEGEDKSVKRVLGHDYPKHCDNSLSRYAWVRAGYTWLYSAAILEINGNLVGINAKMIDEKWHIPDNIKLVYVGNISKSVLIENRDSLKVIKNDVMN